MMSVVTAIEVADLLAVTKFSDGKMNVIFTRNRQLVPALCTIHGSLSSRGQRYPVLLEVTFKDTDVTYHSQGSTPLDRGFANMVFRIKGRSTLYCLSAEHCFSNGTAGNLHMWLKGESYVWNGSFQ